MSDTYHVTPSNDLREHVTDGSDCWCGPETEEVFQSPGVLSGWIVVHKAADGREQYENGERKPQ